MTRQQEDALMPIVEAFVADMDGYYKDYTSDKFLVALLMHQLSQYGHCGNQTRAWKILDGDVNAAYEASCSLFESILECRCGAVGNGHHRAQAFSTAIEEGLGL